MVREIRSRRMRWIWHLARLGEMRNEYTILVGKPRRMRLLGIPEPKWDHYVKIDFGAGHRYVDRI
jgi:hypothetical protein